MERLKNLFHPEEKKRVVVHDPERYVMVKDAISKLYSALEQVPGYASIPLTDSRDEELDTHVIERNGRFTFNNYEWWIDYHHNPDDPESTKTLDIKRKKIDGEAPKKIGKWDAEWDEHLELDFFGEGEGRISNIAYHVSWKPLERLQYAYGDCDDKAFEGVTAFLKDLPTPKY